MRFFSDKKPTVIFTSDTDWADSDSIANLISAFESRGVPLTVFTTNMTPAVSDFMFRHPLDLGPHFNFFGGSTQGNNEDEIINAMSQLSKSICYRNHCFYDNTRLAHKLFDHGFRYDSNICLWLQEKLGPLYLESGIIRFPVWFEDDTAIGKGLNLEQDSPDMHLIMTTLMTSGLKIFNFHPAHFKKMRYLFGWLMYYKEEGAFSPVSLHDEYLRVLEHGSR